MSPARLAALLLFGLIPAIAQQPEAENPAPAGQPATPAAPAGQPPAPAPVPAPPIPGAPQIPVRPPIPGAGQGNVPGARPVADPQAGIPLAERKIVEDITLPKLSGIELAGYFRQYTGKRVIVASAASAAEFAFVQEASAEDPLTYAQAAELLKKAATIENFIFVQDAEDPNLVFLTLATGGTKPNNIRLDVYDETTPLPEGDAVISYVMKLDYIKPDEAVRTFTTIVGQFGAFGSITAVPNAASIVITENTSLVRSLIRMKEEIDQPSSQVSTRFIPVQFADVTELAATLNELLTSQQQTQTTAGIQRAQAPAAPAAPAPGAAAPNVPGGEGSSSGEQTPVQIIPDPRTNRIFAMGRPVDILFIEGLVREFDTKSDDRNFLRRKLKFLPVNDFLNIAEDALNRAFTGTGTGAGAGGAAGAGGGPAGGATGGSNRTSSNRTSQLGGGSSQFGGQSGNNNQGGMGAQGGGGGGGSSLSQSNVSSAPESRLIGRTLLVADNITNSIVVQGPPAGVEIIEKLLDQVDVKADQVMISTVIGQFSKDNSKDYGVGYLFSGSDIRAGGGGTVPIVPIPEGATNRDPVIDPQSVVGGGLRAYGKIGDLDIFLRAVETRGNFTVLGRPSIFTKNNQVGIISSGERIAIPTNSNSFSTGGQSTNIEYRDVVLKLEVRPLINSADEITLEIALLNDEVNGEQTLAGAGPNGQELKVPRITTRELLTTVTVRHGETIVLGGLIITREGTAKSGIPLLSDIPGLGRLFSTTTDTKDRSELLVFIQPSIVTDPEGINRVQADMDSRYSVSGDTRTFADGPGVLPPVDAIAPAAGTGNAAPATKPVPVTNDGSNFNRDLKRPPHRR